MRRLDLLGFLAALGLLFAVAAPSAGASATSVLDQADAKKDAIESTTRQTRDATPMATISSIPPIDNIYLGNDLSCQVKLSLDDVYSFFPSNGLPGDCGTFVGVNGVVYGPDFENHTSGTATSGDNWMPYTPVSQSPVTGTGTASDPYKVVTVVETGPPDLEIEETTEYVAGEKFFTSKIRVINSSPNPIDYRLYRAADCYLAGSDEGHGAIDTEGGVFCSENPHNDPVGRLIGFKPGTDPISSQSSYAELNYSNIWDLTNGNDYSNFCDCEIYQDNGAGLSWHQNVVGNSSVTTIVQTMVDAGPDPFQGASGVTFPSPDSPVQLCEGYSCAQFNLTCNLPGGAQIPCDPFVVVFVDFSTGQVGTPNSAARDSGSKSAADTGVKVFSGQPVIQPGETAAVILDATAEGPAAFQQASANIAALEAEAAGLSQGAAQAAEQAKKSAKKAKKASKKAKKAKAKAKKTKKKVKKAKGAAAKKLAKKAAKKAEKKAKKLSKKAKKAKKKVKKQQSSAATMQTQAAEKQALAASLRTPQAEMVVENQRNGATERIPVKIQLP